MNVKKGMEDGESDEDKWYKVISNCVRIVSVLDKDSNKI